MLLFVQEQKYFDWAKGLTKFRNMAFILPPNNYNQYNQRIHTTLTNIIRGSNKKPKFSGVTFYTANSYHSTIFSLVQRAGSIMLCGISYVWFNAAIVFRKVFWFLPELGILSQISTLRHVASVIQPTGIIKVLCSDFSFYFIFWSSIPRILSTPTGHTQMLGHRQLGCNNSGCKILEGCNNSGCKILEGKQADILGVFPPLLRCHHQMGPQGL